jgi:hypothetical protein
MICLINPDKKQYKANLHCHSVLSDGRKKPEELKEMYKSHGYSILAITDHERPASHQHLADEDFIMITGYENYIRPDASAAYNIYAKEVHLQLLARDPENVKMICYNENYAKYAKRDGALDTLVKAGSERTREFTREYINEYIATAIEHGYLVAYNHPYWSMEDEADILAYEGIFSLEIANYSSFGLSGLEYNAPLYDKMLCKGKRIFCHAADDNHNCFPEGDPRCDSFGAFTMIMPESLSYGAVIDAMESGVMYASMGPTISEVSLDGDRIHIECSEAAHIYAYFGSKSPASAHACDGEVLTSADLKLDSRARYLRIGVCDKYGKFANTRGFSREEIGLPPLEV